MRQKVLVFRTGHFGDTLCAIPAFRLLRRHFTDSELILLCDQAPEPSKVSAASIVQRLNIFDQIVSYLSRRGFRTFNEIFRAVRKLRPTTIVMLPQVRETRFDVSTKRWFFRLCGVRDVRAAQISPNWNSTNLNEPGRLIEILHRLRIPGPKPSYDLPVDASAQRSGRQKFSRCDLTKDSPFIVFCGGGKLETQRWPLSRYAEVMRTLRDELAVEFVAIGDSKDIANYRSELLSVAPFVCLSTGELTAAELAEVLRTARGYLGNDTGPMHLAAAIGCPVAAIMSTRNPPGCWDPDIRENLVIRSNIRCEACLSDEPSVAKHECMMGISADDVVAKVIPFFREIVRSENVTR